MNIALTAAQYELDGAALAPKFQTILERLLDERVSNDAEKCAKKIATAMVLERMAASPMEFFMFSQYLASMILDTGEGDADFLLLERLSKACTDFLQTNNVSVSITS